MKNRARPHVICHMVTTIDGKIKTERWPKDIPFSEHYERIHNKLEGDAWIVGRTSMQGFSSKKITGLKRSSRKISKADFIGDRNASRFAVVIDRSGKCRWESNSITGDHIIEVLTERVPTAYLAHLQDKGISYIFAGPAEIDLTSALKKLKRQFRIERLLLEGGGIINATFLENGLIDELSQLVIPVADGRAQTSTLFDGAGGPGSRPGIFGLDSVKKLRGGVLWLRYTAKS